MRVDESCKTTTGLHFVVAGSAKSCKMADVLEHFSAHEKSEANDVNHALKKRKTTEEKKEMLRVLFEY